MLERGDLEVGHAKALLGLNGEAQSRVARNVAGKSLTVRQTEELVRKELSGDSGKSKTDAQAVDPDIAKLQQQLSEKVGACVQIQHGTGGKGKLVLKYNSLDELDGILQHIR
jgi:ParB family chromosome partitioning protein